MGWSPVFFKRLYYKVANGPEYELTANSLTIPPLISYGLYDTAAWLEAFTGDNAGSYYASECRDNAADGTPVFRYLYGFNGGRGTFNVWYFWEQMSDGQDILIYKESGNTNIALVLRKKSGNNYQFEVFTKWYSTYTSVITTLQMTSINARDTDHSYLINSNAANIGFVTDGSNYRLCFTMIFGSEGASLSYDANRYDYNVCVWRQELSNLVQYLMFGNLPIVNNDPYSDTGEAAEDQLQTGPAQGSGDDTSDTISIPGAPALNLTLNHFISAYVPDLTTLNGLADFIWGNYDRFDSNKKLSKLFADPSDAIISLHMLPFEPSTSTAIEVTIGRYGTSINMPPLTAQFKDVSCGTLTIDPYWANYLDHNPFTRYTLFLPFVGEVQLDPDEIVGETLGVDYRVDCLTGAFVCFVSTATKILAQYQGNCSLQVPTSSADYSRLNSAILTAATAAVGGAVGIGAAAAGAGTVGAGIAAGAGEAAKGIPSFAGNAMNVQQAKVNHSHSGALGGASGFMGSQKPYIIIHRARQSVPADANAFKGYPCNAKFNLTDLEGCGFTVVRDVKLDGLKLSEGELEELRGILGAGVYL